MKTVTVRDLRNSFGMIESLLAEGEEIQIEKRGRPVGILRPWREMEDGSPKPKPDFAARRKAIWGDRVFSASEVNTMRMAELEDEEG